MSTQSIARRYASALAEVAIERHEATEVHEEIAAWSRIIEDHAQLHEVFSNPTIQYDQKRKVLDELIERTKVRETTASFLRVLLKNQRLPQLKYVVDRFGQVLDDYNGVVAANVTTARPIPEDIQQALRESLATAAGRNVRLSFVTDENIIGGIVTQIGSTIFDGSVQGQLERLAADFVTH